MRRSRTSARAAVLSAFFLSGFAGLMHQVVWSKLIVPLIGATAYAQACVLAVFMGGLAVGAVVFGRRVDARGRPLRTYVALELAIAGYCALLPLLLAGLALGYEALAALVFESAGLKLSLRFALALAALGVPAVLMGGTLPVLARHLVDAPEQTRREVGVLYGLNSFGAVLGAGAAGFVTIPAFGIHVSLGLACMLNVAAGAILLGPARRESSPRSPAPAAPPGEAAGYAPDQYAVTLIALACSGFAALGYEVLFTRVIVLAFGGAAHSFTVMLMAFISGISLGSALVARLRVERPLWWLALSQLAVVATLIGVSPLISRLPYLMALLRIELPATDAGFALYQAGKAALCLGVLLLPTTCLGAAFPLVAQVQVRRSPRLGAHVGTTYAWNTAGNVVGAVATSLLLLPALGLLGAFHANLALNGIAGLALLAVAREARGGLRAAVAAVAVAAAALYGASGPDWLDSLQLARNHLRLREGPRENASALERLEHPSASYDAWRRYLLPVREEASHYYFAEDSHATVLVYGDFHEIILYINTKADASTNTDLPTQMFLAHFPLFFHPDARQVLIVGNGSGITAGTALRHPVERVDVVEISDAVLGADEVFADFNYHALSDPRTHVYREDALSFVRAVPRRYDAIISEPSNPWQTGMADLFTLEYFENVRRKLAPHGVATIWFHTYEQTDETVALVLRTLRAVFPYVEIMRSPAYSDMIAVASRHPLVPDFAAMEARFDEPAVRNDLARIGISSLPGLLLHHVVSGARLPALLPAGPLNRLARPRLEYVAARAFYRKQSSAFLSRADSLWQQQDLDSGFLLTRYLRYRERVGEPVSQTELRQLARTALDLGGRGRRVAAGVLKLAERAPDIPSRTSRPARGGAVPAEDMGYFEAKHWEHRYRETGREAEAEPFAARAAQLSPGSSPPVSWKGRNGP